MMNAGSYLLARFSDPEKLESTINMIGGNQEVKQWNAVKGHVDLIVRLHHPNSISDKIRNIVGDNQFFVYNIQTGEQEEKLMAVDRCHAYVFIETEPTKADKIKGAIRKIDNILYCQSLSGGCDLVTVIYGDQFEVIDRIIREKIQPLDGILRLKTDRVIDLKQI
jgi:hypothetical protein